MSPDSVTYMRGARSILENGNLNALGSHWPPLYYLLIAFSMVLTDDFALALRWLQIVTLVANLVCFSCIIWRFSNRETCPALVGGLLFVTAPAVFYIHAMAWSEGAFCLFALLGFSFLARYLESENSVTLLLISSLCIGLAFITRYAGITLIITGMIALVFNSRKKVVKRLLPCLFFGFSSSFFMLIWMGKNWIVSHEASFSRVFSLHPVSMGEIQQGLRVFLNWLHLPTEYPLLLLVVLGVVAIIYGITRRQALATHAHKLPEISFIFVSVYIPFLLVSISFFDAHTPLDNRILIPVYIFFFLGTILLAQRFPLTQWGRKPTYLLLVLFVFLSVSQFTNQLKFVDQVKANGLHFAAKEWVESETLRWLKDLPKDAVIYTNSPEPLEIYTGRSGKMLPNHTYAGSRLPNTKVMQDVTVMADEMVRTNGVIVLFNSVTWRWYLPTLTQLRQVLPLETVYEGKDGIVVRLPGKNE